MPRRRQNGRPTLIAVTLASLVAAIVPLISARAGELVDVVFNPIEAEQSWTVPAGVTSIYVHLIGAKGSGGGGYPGGVGHDVVGDLTVTPGQTIYVEVGGKGIGATPGFNGGGAVGLDGNQGTAGAGGGASDIRTISRTNQGTLDSRLMVAGGGGGAGHQMPGGHAGDRGNDPTMGGQPGSNTFGGGAGGIGDQPGHAGTFGTGGAGGSWCTTEVCGAGTAGGGGGGGYYGGGGGAGMSAEQFVQPSGSGAGGSLYTGNATNVSVGHQSELDASVTIRYIASDPPDPTPGSDSGTVDATISMTTSVCIELSTSSVDFGTGRFGQVGVAGTPEIVVTNCGPDSITLFARGTDASATDASWSLVKSSATCADTLGTDNFHLHLHENQTPDVDWDLGTSNTELEDVASGSIAPLGPSIDTACPGSSGAGQLMSMQLLFTATEAQP